MLPSGDGSHSPQEIEEKVGPLPGLVAPTNDLEPGLSQDEDSDDSDIPSRYVVFCRGLGTLKGFSRGFQGLGSGSDSLDPITQQGIM